MAFDGLRRGDGGSADEPERGPDKFNQALRGHFERYSAYGSGYDSARQRSDRPTYGTQNEVRNTLRRALGRAPELILAEAVPEAPKSRSARSLEHVPNSLVAIHDKKSGLLAVSAGFHLVAPRDPMSYAHEEQSLAYSVGAARKEYPLVLKGDSRGRVPYGGQTILEFDKQEVGMPSEGELRSLLDLVRGALRGEFR